MKLSLLASGEIDRSESSDHAEDKHINAEELGAGHREIWEQWPDQYCGELIC